MATLVLSTVGNALGGPAGSAIGALIGQSIDQELLSTPRRGPRLGDLTVQSSSYGTQIPRLYGTIRVAGSVIWSTDLIEHQQSGGAKGEPDVAYSYTVSFAVALSSRPVQAIKRIWADGNLLRGAAGDFKAGCKFRFYEGGGDQIIDPLIGSIEGISNTPAYRGIAMAVFEDLELAAFGNRIPFLTFEVEADDAQFTLGALLNDASAGLMAANSSQPLFGFAAYGNSIGDALGSLIESYGVELYDDGSALRQVANASPIEISDAELGNSADDQPQPRIERDQVPSQTLPAAIRLTYYDPDRDYQTGEARALAGEQAGKEAQSQLPAVLTASDAKSLAHDMLARTWAQRDRVTLRLPPKHLELTPGSRLNLPLNPREWRVETAKLDCFVIVAELRPTTESSASMSADPGRIAPNPDAILGPVTIALLDVPNVSGSGMNGPMLLLAASSEGQAWRRSAVELDFAGQSIATQTAPFKSMLGRSVTVLEAGESELIDQRNSVDVQLVDADQWLTSCDDDGLAAGMNLAVLGGELLQFSQVLPLGDGRFRLSRLLRGRGGSEWAAGAHAADEVFCLLDAPTLQGVLLPAWSIGSTITAATAGGTSSTIAYAGENVRPLSAVALSTTRSSAGDLEITWTRRSRQGFAWIDGIDAPLGETREQYRIVLAAGDNALEYSSDRPSVTIPSADLALFGSGQISAEVQQIGDFAASRPARLTITYP